jgi:Uma2 family endonuclease
MAANLRTTYTVEEYLTFERQSDTKHEYFAGEIVARAGASYAHNLIVGNVGAMLHEQLRHRACSVVMGSQRILATRSSAVTYPDVMVVCGQPHFTDEQHDTLTNSTVIIEVLSPSTEDDDRGRRFRHYRTLESLQEYVLIAQDEYHVEHYVRAEHGWWHFTEATELDAAIQLVSIECTLALADVYERVTLTEVRESRQ